jgi:hypothetical protein
MNYSRKIIDPTEMRQRSADDMELERVTNVLMPNKDFRTFLHLWMERTRFYFNGAELSPFEQGKRALMSHIIQTSVGLSEDYGKTFMNESGARFAKAVQDQHKSMSK